MKELIKLFSIVLFTLCLTSCKTAQQQDYVSQGFVMGTTISQQLYGDNAKEIADVTLNKIKQLESLMTFNAPEGDINKLNENAGKSFTHLSPETVEVLKSALEISDLSSGAFDITIGPIVKCWGIGSKYPQIPSTQELIQLRALIGFKSIHLDEANNCAKLEKQGQMVDLGGIAKGYAADTAVKIYKKAGINSALINLGGNVVALGSKPDGGLWNVGIQDPRATPGKYIGIVKISDKAVVTSGDYERYFERDGKRYHHIIDPYTGMPAESGLMGVTIISSSSTSADALSTAAFVLGKDRGLELIKKYGKAEAVFITTDKKVYITPGLKKDFTFYNESEEFEFIEER